MNGDEGLATGTVWAETGSKGVVDGNADRKSVTSSLTTVRSRSTGGVCRVTMSRRPSHLRIEAGLPVQVAAGILSSEGPSESADEASHALGARDPLCLNTSDSGVWWDTDADSSDAVEKRVADMLSSQRRSCSNSSEGEVSMSPTTPISSVMHELALIHQEFNIIQQDIDFDGAERIGHGGGGQVYRARLRRSQRIVAVKVMHVEDVEHDCQINKRKVLDMLGEIRVGTTLERHPNLAAFIGACVHRDFPWVVFEYIDGKNLLELYGEQQSLLKKRDVCWHPPRYTALQWAEQLFRALDHLHGNSPPIIHRDVKPANVMLTADLQTVKLVDFGLCRAMPGQRRRSHSSSPVKTPVDQGGCSTTLPDEVSAGSALTRQTTAASSPCRKMSGKTGTYRFMAPEVWAEAETYTTKVDVFSASLVTWYMLTGQLPFARIPTEAIAQMMSREQLRPSLKNFAKVPGLNTFFEKGWAHSEDERGSAVQMLMALKPLLEQERVQQEKKDGSFVRKMGSSLKNLFSSGKSLGPNTASRPNTASSVSSQASFKSRDSENDFFRCLPFVFVTAGCHVHLCISCEIRHVCAFVPP